MIPGPLSGASIPRMVLAPETPAEPSRRQMNVRLPGALIEAIDQRRQEKGLSRDEFVRRALTYALAHGPTPRPGQPRSAPRNR